MERNERRSAAPRPATPARRGRVRLTISKGVLRLVGVPNSPAKLRLPLIESGAARSSSPLPIRSATGVINDGALLSLSLSLSLSFLLSSRGGESATVFFRSPKRLTKVSTIAHFLILARPHASPRLARRHCQTTASPLRPPSPPPPPPPPPSAPANGGSECGGCPQYSGFISDESRSSLASMVGKLNRSSTSPPSPLFQFRRSYQSALRALFIALSRGELENGIVHLRVHQTRCVLIIAIKQRPIVSSVLRLFCFSGLR